MLIANALLLVVGGVAQVYAATTTTSGLVAQFSPIFPSTLPKATGVVTSYNPGPYDITTKLSADALKGYPPTWESPPTSSAEVKKVYDMIDWSKVPKAPVRKQDSNGNWVSDSDGDSDPYCWWSSTNCVKPKAKYLPADIHTCPASGDWGLNYDDGPFNRYDASEDDAELENKYAEPALYNFLAETNNQKASLFYIGSNVVNYPAAAKRGLNDGHHLCVHTWSHPAMTTQTNAQIVAELYWTLKAIKEATGDTSKCWRPPQGDVDDRVRAIAYQMGLRTILWDEDTNDWDMPAPGGGELSPKVVDGYFKKWVSNYESGKDEKGHIVLEHELNSATVNMSMFWLPKLQETFNVIPALACNGISQPYWETSFKYPLSNSPGSPTTTATSSKTTTTTAATPTTTTCTSGSYGLGNGDGYNGACCKDQSDCWDDCIGGKCNGPNSTKSATATKTTTNTLLTSTTCASGSYGLGNGNGYNDACCKDQSDCWDDCIGGKCNGPVNTKTPSKKSITETTTKKPSTTANCIPGTRGKKKGNGKTGYCCSSSDDCLETCRSGKCGL
ncbi:hypothetical protein [Parasitella parasitica]|uniref:NodB homology domain-containing protein n=1 Tax=Parasitella parasitica TaxID=35722 RepID=A0A0B7NI50_9FUNG|nr:hypothetical protein [Parasitella parasitica]